LEYLDFVLDIVAKGQILSEYFSSALSRSFPTCPRLVFFHLATALYKFHNIKYRQTEKCLFTFHMDEDKIQ